MWETRAGALFANDLDQDTLPSTPVELAVENLLPESEIKTPVGDRHHQFALHQLPLQMGIAIVLSRVMMPIGLLL